MHEITFTATRMTEEREISGLPPETGAVNLSQSFFDFLKVGYSAPRLFADEYLCAQYAIDVLGEIESDETTDAVRTLVGRDKIADLRDMSKWKYSAHIKAV